uniref:Uncharacterized protein n=1 Tax=Scylla olivacea TaxID=85551 RepID=A0A0P4WZI6_SCYOL
MPFNFAYAVNDEYNGNVQSHNEDSDGKVTTGQYTVLLPDGRTQTVNFRADHEKGFVAEVSYDGQAQYPSHAPGPAVTFRPAVPPSPLPDVYQSPSSPSPPQVGYN